MIENKWVGKVLMGFGLSLAVYICFNGYWCIKNSYVFNDEENAFYIAFNRTAYLFGNILVYMAIFLGHFEKQRKLMTNDLSRVLGKITYAAALLSPIIVNLSILCQDDAIYLQIFGVIYLGIGHNVVLTIVCFLMYLTFEYPFKYLCEVSIKKHLSHDDLLLQYYSQIEPKKDG